jgi:hypothetical protein
MVDPDPQTPRPLGDFLPEIIKKARPSKRALKGRRLAQQALEEELGPLGKYAGVVSVKVGVVTIETQSAPLFQELEGFRKATLLEKFRAAGLNVREIRVQLAKAER